MEISSSCTNFQFLSPLLCMNFSLPYTNENLAKCTKIDRVLIFLSHAFVVERVSRDRRDVTNSPTLTIDDVRLAVKLYLQQITAREICKPTDTVCIPGTIEKIIMFHSAT